jgi:plastocyanin
VEAVDMAYRGWSRLRVVAAVLTASCVWALPASGQGAKRFFTIAAVEPKGGTTIDKEPFPTASLPDGKGYIIKKPDHTGRWEVSTYVWQPSQIIVTEGDDVTLEFIGINGAEHPTTIVGYDKTLVLKRGHVIRIEFKADKVGTFKIVCSEHHPSMVGELIVMPRK